MTCVSTVICTAKRMSTWSRGHRNLSKDVCTKLTQYYWWLGYINHFMTMMTLNLFRKSKQKIDIYIPIPTKDIKSKINRIIAQSQRLSQLNLLTKVISCDLNHVWSQQQITGCFSLGKIEKDYLRGKTFVLWEIFLPFFPLEKTTITYQHTDQYIMHTFLKQGHDVYAKDVYMCIYIRRWAHPTSFAKLYIN